MAAVGMMAYPVRESYSGYPQQYPVYQSRSHHAHHPGVSSLNINPYANFAAIPQQQQPQPQQPQHFQQQRSRSPQSSVSPVSEEGNRPSLPSISNLLGIADGDRPSHDSAPQPAQQQCQPSQQPLHAAMLEQRQRTSHPVQDLPSSQRNILQPTPPLRNDSVIENTQSSSALPAGSSMSAQPYFVGSALNNMDADHQRAAQANFLKRQPVPQQSNTSPYGVSSYMASSYNSSPSGISNASYYSPPNPAYPTSNLYHQRPLPSNFPPSTAMPAPSASSAPAPNVWEHHHYISPSSQASFPQSQDRYICQTCNKAFSRPSSLKIHSHSHTGEKPFKCPHTGCGKAFSVRSNMKRHERGCHSGTGNMGPLVH